MDEQELNLQEQEEQEVNLAEDINAWKANTVSKEAFNRVQAERDQLARALMRGETVEVEAPEKPDINELRTELYTEDVQKLSDLQFVEKTLQLRNAIIEDGGRDPFLPFGTNVAPEESDFAAAERVAKVFQECVDLAGGNNALFLAELQRRTMDVNPISTRAKTHRR